MAQVRESLRPTWETQPEFRAPNPKPPSLQTTLGIWRVSLGRRLCVYLLSNK